MNVFLIGFRCTGKSSVGKALAQRLTYPFKDADEEVVKETGMTIADVVAKHGWQYFREKERAVIQRLSMLDNHVIATGGGVILNRDNITDMKRNGFMVWLKAMPDTIRQRILQDKITDEQRPALTDKGLVGEIEETLGIRNPLYEQAADISVDTDDLDIKEVVSVLYLTFLKKC